MTSRAVPTGRLEPRMRQHLRWSARGKWVEKVKYATADDARVHAAHAWEGRGYVLVPYRCGVCAHWHIGRPRFDRSVDVIEFIELGPRAALNLKHENGPTRAQRLRAIRSRTRGAEKRRAALAA